MTVYRIANFERFEHPDAKRGARMPWVKTPTTHDGLGYLAIMDHPNGEAHFGIWNILLQLAANGTPRGVLATDGGRVLGAREVSLKTRAKQSLVDEAITRLVQIGWIEVASNMQATCKQHARQEERRARGEQEESKRQEEDPNGSEADFVGPEFSTRDGAWRMTVGFRDTLAQTFPAAPLDMEIVKAATWTHDAPKKKTAGGMHRFLLNWFGRTCTQPTATASEGPSDDAIAAAKEAMVQAKLNRKP